jgi:hypothetical protein
LTFDDNDIRRYSISRSDVDNIPLDNVLGVNLLFGAVSNDNRKTGNHFFEGVHDVGRLAFLVVGKGTAHGNDQ